MSNLYRGPLQMHPTKFRFIWPSGFREDFQKSTNQKQELPVAPCLLMDRDEMSNRYRGPPIDASYNGSVHLAQPFQRRRFLKIGQSEKRIACGGHVCLQIRTTKAIATEDCPQIFPSKFRYIWPNSFRREEFLKSANQKQESPVAAMFVKGLGRKEQ